MGRKATKPAPGQKAAEITAQIEYAMEQLIGFKSAREVRQGLSDLWGLEARTADRRIKCAREAIRDDVGQIDRQEMAATLTDMLHKIAAEATERGQFNNTIGAMRLIGEIAGITGNNRA